MNRVCHILFLVVFTQFAYAQTTIKMEKMGGVYKIPCKVNGLCLKFIFDTGASDVTLSLTEALFMLKNGYLSDGDFRGTEYYRIANGDIQEGTKVNLKSIEVGGQKIYNVEASITHTADAPLLFGQSALQRFGNFSIDYATNTLSLGGGNGSATSPKSTAVPRKEIDYSKHTVATIWMTKNLNVSTFRNGDPIPEAKTDEEWKQANSNEAPAWCYYNNDTANCKKYGKLYNWYAVNDSRGLAPKGWHIPSHAEWTTLINFFSEDGSKMKAASGWDGMPGNGDNTSGFAGLPGGMRAPWGSLYEGIGSYGDWWSTTECDDNPHAHAWHFELRGLSNYTFLDDNNKWLGFSVRCLRN